MSKLYDVFHFFVSSLFLFNQVSKLFYFSNISVSILFLFSPFFLFCCFNFTFFNQVLELILFNQMLLDQSKLIGIFE